MNALMRRGAARLAAAFLASGLAAVGPLAAAAPAAADDAPRTTGGVTATLGRITQGARAVVKDSGRATDVLAGLYEMKVDDGGNLQTYSVDIRTNAVDGTKYKEADWAESSLHANQNAGKIRWILENSYPQVNDLAKLAKAAGADKLGPNTAAAGTQVAIWRYADGVTVDAADPDAQKLADHLYKNAENLDEPKASLRLGPPAVSGRPGQRIGPVTVRTTAGSVTVTPSGDAVGKGIKIVDKDGKPVTSTTDGGQVYFDVPAGAADGTASLKAGAATKVPVGRAFIGVGTKTQTQVLAGSSEATTGATATATWAQKGAIPAVSGRKDCARGGMEVTTENKGDQPFAFELDGRKDTVGPGASKAVLVTVAEDHAYRITVTGPHGFAKTFSGILDCRTAGIGTTSATSGPLPSASPSGAAASRTAGTAGSAGRAGASAGGDLAGTGSSSATPLMAGVAVVLMIAGGTAVYLLRRREA
ncbi:TQXA domain-containing protein [Streptomyces mashuensis]|uniref:TQXA domain-containing protein n=1 Tax=Streptomyces mashuensis TaxID=33904 RepID=A0A919B042_9ACTN|nr:thioester domain-containing protein [Streptomyces mashuensis]GHF35968.1 TQXA domain-containing protein [Streptomyces mashuensis]